MRKPVQTTLRLPADTLDTIDEALRNPALRRVLEIGAVERRQLARDPADRTTAGRLLDTTALDAYERCGRESHVMEEAW